MIVSVDKVAPTKSPRAMRSSVGHPVYRGRYKSYHPKRFN